MPKAGHKTRIAVLIVVAMLAIALGMLEALASEPGDGPASAGAGVSPR